MKPELINVKYPKNLDEVHLNKEQLLQLFKWKDLNKDLVREFAPILDKGIIIVDDLMIINFEDNYEDKEIIYNLFDDDHTFLYQIIMDSTNRKQMFVKSLKATNQNITNKRTIHFLNSYQQMKNEGLEADMLADVITTHASAVSYMQYQKKQIITRNENIKLTKKEQERWERTQVKQTNDNNDHKVTIYPTKIIYQYPQNISIKKLTKKEFIKGSWNVRGHLRKLKNGNKTFVKPYIKGKDRNKIKNKVYDLKF